MKKLLFMSAVMLAFVSAFAEMPRFAPKSTSPRIYDIGKKSEFVLIENGKVKFEVVIPSKANRSVRFAAQELAGFLSQISGTRIPVIHRPSGKKFAFLIGDRKAAAEAGIDLKKIDRDGFHIKTHKGNMIIIGNDDPAGNPALLAHWNERGSLYGVYDFLERFAGVRFYFPGKYGTIVPRKTNWSIPSADITDRPDSQFRRFYSIELKDLNRGKKDFLPAGMTFSDINRLTTLRTRMGTMYIPNCHGLAFLGLTQRFRKSHPEYFALKADGTRVDGTNAIHPNYLHGHLCFSSGINEVIYQDAAAFLQGRSAESRGIVLENGKSSWNPQIFSRPFFNIMPNDSLFHCRCAVCKPIYAKGKQSISNHIWGFTVDIAKRLKKNRIPGYITAMAYSDYKSIPDVEIPNNMIVQLAITGPWNEANKKLREHDDKLLADWYKKLGQKTYLWTYANKCGSRIADIPNFTPKAVASFFKRSGKHVFGAFLESETDHWFFGFMNLYVFGKVMWDLNTDVDALIDEHCRLMYGPGAPQMKAVYSAWEKHWLNDIVTNIRETSLGPQAVLPSEYELWSRIYSAAEVKNLEALFDLAEKNAAKDPDALGRIKFIRKEIWGKVIEGRKGYDKANSDRRVWTGYMTESSSKITIDGKLAEKEWKKSVPLYMIPRKGSVNDVQTKVSMLCDKENFYVAIESEEPHTDLMLCGKRAKDDGNIWRDNLVELFFAPHKHSEIMYQIMINSDGSLTDMRSTFGKHDSKWDSGVEYRISTVPGKKWIMECRIPVNSMPELKNRKSFMANFTRGRLLKGKHVMPFYVWAPFPRHIAENCGVINIGRMPPDNSLIKFGDFDGKVMQKRFIGDWGNRSNWFTRKQINKDTRVFRTSGASLRLEGTGKGEVAVCQYLYELKPNTKYRFSYFVKLQDVKCDGRGGFYLNLRMGGDSGLKRQTFSFPGNAMTGTNDWVRFEHEIISTPDVGTKHRPYVGIYLSAKASGTAWVDNVKLTEVKK